MTIEQDAQLRNVRDKIKKVRDNLDRIMYCSTPLSDEEYSRLREGYDLLCQANDKLY